MSLSASKVLLCSRIPLIQICRNRTRTPNIRKPAIPHWHRAVVLKLTKPIYRDPEEGLHPAERCGKKIKAAGKLNNQVCFMYTYSVALVYIPSL